MEMIYNKPIILVATDEEETLAKKYLRGYMIFKTGVGAANAINKGMALSRFVPYENYINIGFAGSNILPIGTVKRVSYSFLNVSGKVDFPIPTQATKLASHGVPCFTDIDFVTESPATSPQLYDMELQFLMMTGVNITGAIKIVSDNLSPDQYYNSIKRPQEEQWTEVREILREIEEEQEAKKEYELHKLGI